MIDILVRNQGVFFSGLATTMLVSLVAIVLGGALGLALARGLLSAAKPLRAVCALYRSFWRGTPLLVQLLLVFYLLPRLGLELSPLVCAVAVLALNTAAFQAEIYRSGFLAIPAGQIEAARMLGLPRWRTFRRIEVPQMVRLVLPALTNETIAIVKNSSLISVIAVTELMRRSQQISAANFRPLETYLIAALLYLAVNVSLAFLSAAAEKRLALSGSAA